MNVIFHNHKDQAFDCSMTRFSSIIQLECIKKCTPFQISHNLLNIRCSAVNWPILYLMQT
jgi:hypothetical protein